MPKTKSNSRHLSKRGAQAQRTTKQRISSLDALFRPRSVAVIGAGRTPNTIGHEIVRNLVRAGFSGPVYPVNPKATVVRSMHCYPDVGAIPGHVDLALLVVPAKWIAKTARECGEKGVRGLVCITAGFAEVGGAGIKRQEELLRICEQYGMRLVGPNCMGILNTQKSYSMNASFANAEPSPGQASFMSQSGALGAVILNDARSLGLGVRMFVSLGNRADVSPSDLLEYWEHDEQTLQILMYLEAFGDPERFMRIARRVSRHKPILVVKAGRSARGARAAISHTGSLAGSEVAVDSLLSQCGVLRVESMKELFSLASAVQTGRFPAGKRVGIVTNAGGPAILATDACVAEGLELCDLRKTTRKKLEAFLPPEASTANPVDMIASADAKSFDSALKLVMKDPNVDMALAIFVAPIMIDAVSVAEVFAKHARQGNKPLLACLPGLPESSAALEVLHQARVPNFSFPDDAARVLAGLNALRELRERPADPAPKFRVRNRKRVQEAIKGALDEGREVLDSEEVTEMMRSYGIPVVDSAVVENREDALRAARRLKFPLVGKIVSEHILHKSDRGGVLVDIRNREELLAAYDTLEERFAADTPDMRVLLQSMRSDGVETFFGVATDPLLGRLLAFGLGGIHVEILKDVVFRLHPLTMADARDMVENVRGKALFEGARGKPPVDKNELVGVLLRLSQMLSEHPEIAEIDINPFLAAYEGKGSCALDLRCRVQAVHPAQVR